MTLPLRLTNAGAAGRVTLELTREGLAVSGKRAPRLDVLVELWDALVTALALEEVDLTRQVKRAGHESRVAQARAALQIRLARRGH